MPQEEIPQNCLATRQLTKVEKQSPFSLIQYETYTSYDTCNHTIIKESKEWNLAQPFVSIVLVFLMAIFAFLLYNEERLRNKNGR